MFTNSEKESVLEYYIDYTQDPKVISQELEIDINLVKEILKVLSEEGQIEGFKNESKVYSFSEFKSYNS